jgi:hypothetical protein
VRWWPPSWPRCRTGDLDGAAEMARAVVDGAYESGDMIWRGRATAVLVELLVRRGSAGDLHEVQAVIDRLAAVPTDPLQINTDRQRGGQRVPQRVVERRHLLRPLP